MQPVRPVRDILDRSLRASWIVAVALAASLAPAHPRDAAAILAGQLIAFIHFVFLRKIVKLFTEGRGSAAPVGSAARRNGPGGPGRISPPSRDHREGHSGLRRPPGAPGMGADELRAPLHRVRAALPRPLLEVDHARLRRGAGFADKTGKEGPPRPARKRRADRAPSPLADRDRGRAGERAAQAIRPRPPPSTPPRGARTRRGWSGGASQLARDPPRLQSGQSGDHLVRGEPESSSSPGSRDSCSSS